MYNHDLSNHLKIDEFSANSYTSNHPSSRAIIIIHIKTISSKGNHWCLAPKSANNSSSNKMKQKFIKDKINRITKLRIPDRFCRLNIAGRPRGP